MGIKDIIMNNVKLNHDIAVSGYMGKTTHVLIFQDKEANTYYWVTSSYPTEFVVDHIYNIKAKLGGSRLSYVKIIEPDDKSKSEQPDAEEVLFGLAHYQL